MKAEHQTVQKLTIENGTRVDVEPPHTRTYAIPMASILIAMSDDSTAEFLMPLDEAIELGFVT